MALTRDRNTPTREAEFLELPVAAGAKIFAGALVAISAIGYAVPGSTAVGLKAAGRAEQAVDNTGGADGAVTVRVRRGTFKFKNAAGDQVGLTHVLGNCYIVDDETVAATDGVGTRSVAGKVIGVDNDGVWVQVR